MFFTKMDTLSVVNNFKHKSNHQHCCTMNTGLYNVQFKGQSNHFLIIWYWSILIECYIMCSLCKNASILRTVSLDPRNCQVEPGEIYLLQGSGNRTGSIHEGSRGRAVEGAPVDVAPISAVTRETARTTGCHTLAWAYTRHGVLDIIRNCELW